MKYELHLRGEESVAFKEQVKKKMKERDLSVEDLAEAICYAPETLYQFFKAEEWNRFLAASIADELGIKFSVIKKVGDKNGKN
ncbi:MAG: hypothetical protein UFG06_13825 [Lachnospiraceae bacterium]|nr:hypothetical protein [Lachnospiraceae bacterium]